MTPETTLPVIAQVAATFAGFTALVSVVDRGQGGKWARISIWRIMTMLRTSLILLFLCLLPAILHSLNIPSPLVWKVSISVVLFVGCLNWLHNLRATRELSRPDAPRINQTIRKVNMALAFSGMALQAVALAGIFPLELSGVYLLSMAINLMLASLVFYALIQQLDIQRLEIDKQSEQD